MHLLLLAGSLRAISSPPSFIHNKSPLKIDFSYLLYRVFTAPFLILDLLMVFVFSVGLVFSVVACCQVCSLGMAVYALWPGR